MRYYKRIPASICEKTIIFQNGYNGFRAKHKTDIVKQNKNSDELKLK